MGRNSWGYSFMKIRIQLVIILSILFLGLVGCSGTDTESVLPVTVNNIETESQEQVSEEVTGEQIREEAESQEPVQTNTYILNTNTKKFHYPGCKSVKK